MRLSSVVMLAAALLPTDLRAEAHADAATFGGMARDHIGQRVTLDHCHLVYATSDEITCIGLIADGAVGDVRAAGKFLIRIAAAETRSRARATALCDGGDLGEACDVSVSGEVFDASRSFGLDEARLLGLRDATICWPD